MTRTKMQETIALWGAGRGLSADERIQQSQKTFMIQWGAGRFLHSILWSEESAIRFAAMAFEIASDFNDYFALLARRQSVLARAGSINLMQVKRRMRAEKSAVAKQVQWDKINSDTSAWIENRRAVRRAKADRIRREKFAALPAEGKRKDERDYVNYLMDPRSIKDDRGRFIAGMARIAERCAVRWMRRNAIHEACGLRESTGFTGDLDAWQDWTAEVALAFRHEFIAFAIGAWDGWEKDGIPFAVRSCVSAASQIASRVSFRIRRGERGLDKREIPAGGWVQGLKGGIPTSEPRSLWAGGYGPRPSIATRRTALVDWLATAVRTKALAVDESTNGQTKRAMLKRESMLAMVKAISGGDTLTPSEWESYVSGSPESGLTNSGHQSIARFRKWIGLNVIAPKKL